jgi:hypothetical protein
MSLSVASQSAMLSTAEGLWEALQQRVTERRPSLAGPMRHGQPLSLDEHKLVIGFTSIFSLEYLRDSDNFVVVRDAAQALLERSFHIVLVRLGPREQGMKVFISWSGPRSKAAASALRQWLPDVIQFIDPWMSSEDIDAGARWSNEVTNQLAETRCGIICLTKDNQTVPWVLFEVGCPNQPNCCDHFLDLSDWPQLQQK